MPLYNFLQAVLITSAIAARIEPRQIVVTVTAEVPPSPPGGPAASSPASLSAAPVPWEQTPPDGISASQSQSITFAQSKSVTIHSPAASGVPKCDKGYTYCGYTLTGENHNFPAEDIARSYCTGLPDFCAGGKFKTDVGEAVFVCLSEQPAAVQLMCACSGTCLNNATTNFIAHCDKPCVNK
ncbi:hypothetical protein F4861DRAFT_334958 [Xylaria intraflava]|nr:hypothetical protein F4861DRAFT_334958 [Xylaria intraflava]